jgi:hypothetical protein
VAVDEQPVTSGQVVAGRLARSLRDAASVLEDRADRLQRSGAELAAAEDRADLLVGRSVAAARRLAAAGGVDIPRRSVDEALEVESHPAVLEADHLVRVRVAELRRRSAATGRSRRLEATFVGTVSALLLGALGWVAAARGGAIPADAISRVQGALAVVAGRDPHPESIGFIWGPFPTLFQVPLVALRSWWPELTAASVAATTVSAICTGLLLAQLVDWARTSGAPRWARLGIVGLTLASPLVLLYGANGMSEACWMVLLVLAVRSLARWAEQDDTGALVLGGVALGAAYLTRYETAASILAAALFVVVVSAQRRRPDDGWELGTVGSIRSPGARRVRSVLLDLAILAFPVSAAVIGWSVASYVIVGEPLAQLTSDYGNAALVRAGAAGIEAIIGDTSVPGRVGFYLEQLLVAAPLVIPLLLVALWLGGRTARRASVAAAVVGAPLVLQLVLAGRGDTFPWFRYVVGAVVLSSLLAALCAGTTGRPGRSILRPVAVLALVPGLVLSWSVVLDGALGSADDLATVDAVVGAVRGESLPAEESVLVRAADVAGDLSQEPGVTPGSVLTDASSTFAVVSASPDPSVFIIPSDRDFEAVVSDPGTFGVRYLLLRLPASTGDAVVAAHPGLLDDSDPEFEVVRTWGSDGDRSGRYVLVRVVDPRGEPRPTPDEGFLD